MKLSRRVTSSRDVARRDRLSFYFEGVTNGTLPICGREPDRRVEFRDGLGTQYAQSTVRVRSESFFKCASSDDKAIADARFSESQSAVILSFHDD